MTRLALICPVLWIWILATCSTTQAKTGFIAGDIAGRDAVWMTGDMDGDGLSEFILLDGLVISIFYQDSKLGFINASRQTYRLDSRPCVVWTAKLGGKAGSLLVLNHDGVDELGFTNRTGPPDIRHIIRTKTIIPDSAESAKAKPMTLSAESQSGAPLILAPTREGLEVWERRDQWSRAQIITQAVDFTRVPSVANPGFTEHFKLSQSIGDMNGDGRDDLIIHTRRAHGSDAYNIYMQGTNGLFGLHPTSSYDSKTDPRSWLCWTDFNRDGKPDLIQSLGMTETSFAPGFSSGKVVARLFIADPQGRIPGESQQILRKNDWQPSLPVVDLDGDGYPDLVLGYSTLDSREGLRKQLTAKQLDYKIGLHFWHPGEGFSKTADCQRDLILHLDRAALILFSSPRHYFLSGLLFGGDFNGDGKTDLLVRDQSDGISVYHFVSRQKGFSMKPDMRFDCADSIEEWEAKDLNNDGVSDLILKLAGQKGFRIFTSQTSKP